MLMKTVTVAAGLLAVPAAHAFLIPPNLSEADIQAVDSIEAVPTIANTQAVELECPGCPILIKTKHGYQKQVPSRRPNHLELTFSINSGPSGDRLMVNNFELYPAANPFQGPLLAPQAFNKEDGKENEHHDEEERHHKKRPHHRRPQLQPQRLGFGMHIGPAKKDAEGGYELIELDLQILEIGFFPLTDEMPGLKINLIREPSGKLLMTTIEKSTPQPTGDENKLDECTNVFCVWMAAARERMAKFKKMKFGGGCHGKMKGGMGMHYPTPPPHHPHYDPTEHNPEGHPILDQGEERVPPRELTWGRLLKNITRHILLPVLVGIVAGVMVSLIGMFVGTVIVQLWRFFVRKPSSKHHHPSGRHSCHKASHQEVAVVAEEKTGLMAATAEETDDLPPPPAYQDEDTPKKPADA